METPKEIKYIITVGAARRYNYPETYYFSSWCSVDTDHASYIMIVTKEHKRNTYRSGTKVFEYSKEFFQSIWSTFNYLVPVQYGAGITVWKNNR